MIKSSLYSQHFYQQSPRPTLLAWPQLAVLAMLLCIASDIGHTRQQLNIVIVGLEAPLEEQVRAYIGNPTTENTQNLSEYSIEIAATAEKSLQALGFYDAKAISKYASYKNDSIIEVKVSTGIPTTIKNIHLNVTGDASENAEFQNLLKLLPIREGKILNHSDYERSKDIIHNSARNLGFFHATFKRSQILVTRKSHSADIYIDFDSGTRHYIDEVKYPTTLFDKKFLERWQPFSGKVPYRASHVLELTQNLQNSGYFNFVRVSPETDLIEGNTIPLTVDLEPARENVMSIGIGFATNTGIRVKGSWLRPHHNDLGHQLKTDSSVSRLRKEITASYQIPHKVSPATGKYSIDLGVLNHRTDETYSQLRSLNFSDQRLTRGGWYRDSFIRWENENTTGSTERLNLLLPGIGFSRTKTSGGLLPEKGLFFSFNILGGSKYLLSDVNMIRATASAKVLSSWDKRHYLIARTDLGALKSNKFSRIPTSHRFFAGGDNSIRGFAYQSISPLNSDGEATGGKYLMTASAEYNYYIRDRWALAAFIDTGRAYKDSDEPYKVGIGAGIRWLSPVGPLRIDLATGISETEKTMRLHLAIGPQL